MPRWKAISKSPGPDYRVVLRQISIEPCLISSGCTVAKVVPEIVDDLGLVDIET